MFDYVRNVHPSAKSPCEMGGGPLQCKVMDASFFCFATDVCQYRKVYPFSGGSPLVQPSAYDFHFRWNQVPCAVGEKISFFSRFFFISSFACT